MTNEEAIKIAVDHVLELGLFPAKVFVPNAPWENDPPPTEVFLVEVCSTRKPFVVGRTPYPEFLRNLRNQ